MTSTALSSRLSGPLAGPRKAAALLITIGKERSAEVLLHLQEEDIELLTREISSLGTLSPENRRQVVAAFGQAAGTHSVISLGGVEYAEDVLRLALGDEVMEQVGSFAVDPVWLPAAL